MFPLTRDLMGILAKTEVYGKKYRKSRYRKVKLQTNKKRFLITEDRRKTEQSFKICAVPSVSVVWLAESTHSHSHPTETHSSHAAKAHAAQASKSAQASHPAKAETTHSTESTQAAHAHAHATKTHSAKAELSRRRTTGQANDTQHYADKELKK